MRAVLILLVIIFSFAEIRSQSQVYSQNIRIAPRSGNGLVGTMHVKYVFRNCFGDAFMGYGYHNVKIEYLAYNGERYYANDLGITSLEQFVILARADVNIYKIVSGSKTLIKSKFLNSMSKDDSFGCYSDGVNLGPSEKENISYLNAEFKNAELSFSAGLIQKVKHIISEKENEKKLQSLTYQISQTSDPEKAIELLTEATKYTDEDQVIEEQIQSLREVISETNSQEIITPFSPSNDYAIATQSTAYSQETAGNNGYESDYIRQLKLQQQEFEALQEEQRLEQESFDRANLIATQQIQNGNFTEAGMTYAQEFANQGNFEATAITAGAGIVGQIISDTSKAKKQREAAEKRRQAELAQKREAERTKRELLKKQKDEFENAAKSQIDFKKSVIVKRKMFVSKEMVHTKLYDQFSSNKAPIYLFCALVQNDFDFYQETIQFPETIDIQIKEDARLTFSPIIKVFPNLNGEYPYFRSIKSQIQELFGEDHSIIKIYNWSYSLEEIKENYRFAMIEAEEFHFKPVASNTEIMDLNIISNVDNHYWTNQTTTDSISSEKIDYWKMEKNRDSISSKNIPDKSGKTDYWKQ